MRRPRAATTTDRAVAADGSQRVWVALVEQQARLNSTLARLPGARADDVHDARVAARRLRSLLKTYRPLLDERGSRRLRCQLRQVARTLSSVREADVRREMLLALARLEPALPAADLGRLRTALRESRAGARRSLLREVASTDWASSVAELGDERTLSALAVRGDTGLARVLELVDRPWRGVEKLLARPPKGAARLHRLRLALKRCRYALESVSGVKPERAEQVLVRLRSAQDRLGEYCDAAQAREWLIANEERLGQPLTRRLDRALRAHQEALGAEAVDRAVEVWPAYSAWRRASRALRMAPEATRGRA
jgi:CHAD domain-containing protein